MAAADPVGQLVNLSAHHGHRLLNFNSRLRNIVQQRLREWASVPRFIV
jgi:hypothetical protein